MVTMLYLHTFAIAYDERTVDNKSEEETKHCQKEGKGRRSV